jgi:hypothetical protein
MEPVQEWVAKHQVTIGRLSGQKVRALDFSDDRLAACLVELHQVRVWQAVEKELGQLLLRVYDLTPRRLRLDATVGTVEHNLAGHSLFKVGKAKNGWYTLNG